MPATLTAAALRTDRRGRCPVDAGCRRRGRRESPGARRPFPCRHRRGPCGRADRTRHGRGRCRPSRGPKGLSEKQGDGKGPVAPQIVLGGRRGGDFDKGKGVNGVGLGAIGQGSRNRGAASPICGGELVAAKLVPQGQIRRRPPLAGVGGLGKGSKAGQFGRGPGEERNMRLVHQGGQFGQQCDVGFRLVEVVVPDHERKGIAPERAPVPRAPDRAPCSRSPRRSGRHTTPPWKHPAGTP